MRLEDMLKNVSGITNKVINSNCWDGQFNVLEGIQVLQCKVNEIITAINNGIIKGDKGDKGDTPNVKVGETTTLEPNSKATVSQTGDMLNPIFNFGIPKGEKGDTGKASESINDNLIDTDHTFSSEKITTMFNSLQDVKGLKYGTDKDYLVMNGTKNGVVKDLKIKGRSLVNELTYAPKDYQLGSLIDGLNKKVTLNCTNSASHSWFKKDMKNGEVWSVSFDVLENTLDSYFSFAYGDSSSQVVIITVNSLEKGHFEKTFTCSRDSSIFKIGQFNRDKNGKVVIDNICLVRNQVPNLNYLEGIASVGNGNEIEVLSVDYNGNVFNNNQKISYEVENWKFDGNQFNIDTQTKYSSNWYWVRVEPNTKYYAKVELDAWVRIYKGKTTSHGDGSHQLRLLAQAGNEGEFTTDDSGWITVRFTNELKLGKSFIKNLIISKNNIPYVDFKQDKKPILFKDTDGAWKPVTELRGIDVNSCDILDSTVNKLYRNFGEVLFNGSDLELWENLVLSASGLENYLAFGINIENGLPTTNTSNYVIDTIGFANNELSTVNNNGVLGKALTIHSNGKLYLRIEKSLLSTPDVAGFKKWLQANNVRIVYRLAQRKVYEVNPLDLESFENETMISFKYGVVNGESEFYVDSNLGSITLNTMKRVSNIENEVFQVKKIVLNGDYRTLAESTYPQDFKGVK